MTQVRVDARFTGPPEVVNGGYACGTVAAELGGAAEVSLWRPVPVDTALELEVTDGRAVLRSSDGEELATGRALGEVDLDLPDPVVPDVAEAAMAGYPARDWGDRMFPCFVCGPDRADTFGVFPGPVAGRDVVAAVWRPEPELADEDGVVPDVLTWAVLDCTGTWGTAAAHDLATAPFLARMEATTRRPARVGETYVTVGWPLERDGRKHSAGAAIFDEVGDPIAHARLLCIEPR